MKNIAIFAKIKDWFKNVKNTKNKKNIFLIIGLILGAGLLIFSFFLSSNNAGVKDEKTNVSILDYSSNVELKLEEMLLNLNEVTNVSVMVMVDSSPKIEYLTEREEEVKTDEKGSLSTISTTVVFEKNGSTTTPVVVTTIMPKITGVFIVLNNISASTKISIINSVSVVLNIDPSCISILQES